MDIKLLVMDVDGTLTDGCIYMGANGEMMKAFHCQDSPGIRRLLPKAGITPAILTGRSSHIVTQRAAEMGITHVYQGVDDKLPKLRWLAEELGLTPDQIAYIGDDINDLDCIRYCGCTACPSDSAAEILPEVDYVCKRGGGRGAVREFIQWLLTTHT